DVNRGFRLSTYLVAAGALLNTVGYVLVMEGPGEEYEAAKSTFWKTMDSWRSNANPPLAAVTFYISFSALALIAAVAFVKAIRAYSATGRQEREHVQTAA